MSRGVDAIPPTTQHNTEHHQATRLPSSRYVPPNEGRPYMTSSTKQSRKREDDTFKPRGNPCGTRKAGEEPSTRHVRFDPVSVPLPSRSWSPSFLPRTRHASAQPSVPTHQQSSSVAMTTPERLRIASKNKGSVTPTKRIEELTRENGLLRQELLLYKETHAILLDFLHVNERLQKRLKSSIEDTIRKLAVAEQPLRDYWGLDNDGRHETETMF
ncbi:MAG: hypothetical protein Q9209_007154 [Squamulea sp. 1 TL-2023]